MTKRSLGMVSPLVALAVGACSPDAPGNPVAAPAAEARAASLAVADDATAALRVAVDDARTRVLPTLGDAAAAGRLDQALSAARAALDANDAGALAAALRQARDAVASGRASMDEGAAVELEALLPLFTTLDDAVPAALRDPTLQAH